MFLHIGENIMVPLKEMISIIDLTENPSGINSEFLKTAEEEGFVVQLGDKPVSLVVCAQKVYLSPISAQTLFKRANHSGLELKL
ncbi:MAG: DUF370 domain-containing protein [Firmicutes bacterium]|mgnify:FL=1|nr:DUF370 domain-containing protein [Bacillota bacterium]